MSIFVLGVDRGKTFCSLVGPDEEGAVVLRRTIRRSGSMKVIEKLAPKVAAMEACCGAHFVGRQCQTIIRDIETRAMYAGVVPFLAMDIVRILLLLVFPALALAIPQSM